eukprot:7245356-Pyramimonas_sp.AAC.1
MSGRAHVSRHDALLHGIRCHGALQHETGEPAFEVSAPGLWGPHVLLGKLSCWTISSPSESTGSRDG